MNLARRRGLPATLLGLALTAGVVAAATPAHAAGEAPTGSFTLDSTSIYLGQQVKLTQTALADDTTAPESISRTIAWGDGTSSTATADDKSWTHKYATSGTYAVSVTLNDGDVEGTGTLSGGASVGVGTVPGTYGWQKSPVWTAVASDGSAWSAKSTLTASGLPANASNRWLKWTDGGTSLLSSSSSTSVAHYYQPGSWSPTIALENAQGRSNTRAISPLSVQIDATLPSVNLVYPASPNKASSYTTIKGKAADSQAGVEEVGVVLWKWNATSEYIYNFTTRTWTKYTGQSLPNSIWGYSPVDSAGNWHVTSSGLSKGWRIDIGFYAMDKVGNATETKWATVTLNS
jgi:hypothetical protein